MFYVCLVQQRAAEMAPSADVNRVVLHVVVDGPKVGVGSAVDMDRRPTAASLAGVTWRYHCVVPVSGAPKVVQPHRQLREIAEPPPRQPQEGLHDGWAVQHCVQNLVDPRERHDDDPLHGLQCRRSAPLRR